jgi:hypothetical protein
MACANSGYRLMRLPPYKNWAKPRDPCLSKAGLMSILDELKALVAQNPNRAAAVDPIQIRVVSDTQEGEDAPTTMCGWVPTPLEPPGPLSLVLWKTNPEYRAGTINIRRDIIRDEIVKVAKRVEAECRGHRWSRKKIQEQLAAQQSADISPPQDTRDLDEALAFLYEVQIVMVDEANKKVRWVPEDPRNWSKERPVWGATVGSRAVLHRPGEEPVSVSLAAWVSEREAAQPKWRIEWPVADGTLEALKASLTKLGAGLGPMPAGEKPKKADYAAATGRAEAIRHLATEFS